ncbi:hypothetical protein RvY_08217 [Ramazzottius varieornatus]|uniref:BED-type domain-containing protein n=1 Tax=Ramazzottius varieornatus TaxID=947166 RepID=A0A1D1V528_RAMVA|nr:hypothetical protein RvY_08217 [Ramazzottius varieornatus]
MANVKGPAWNYLESLNVSRGNEEVKCRFCGKLYKSAKEGRLVDHLLKQCPAVSNEAKTAAGHPDTTATLPQLVAQVEGDQDGDDSSDDESEEKSHGKPWIEAIEQSRYTDFVCKHHACTKQFHAILTQEQLMGRRKSIRSLGYHARSVFLVS